MIRNLFLVGRQWWSLRGNWSPVRVFFGGKLFRSKPRIAALNFASWKRDIFRKALAEFDVKFIRLRDGENSISHAHSKRGFEAIVIWGYPNLDWVDDTAKRLGIPIWRIEDGFLRSVGLGANHVAPLSYFLDRTGIHFDPSTPSDLENTLLTYDFDADPALMERARKLIEHMISQGISKYNGMPAASVDIARPYVLVLGQCEDDASIRLGASPEWTNQALAELAIRENPGVPILFRPHPDVAAGHRKRRSAPEKLAPALKVISGDIALGPVLAGAAKVYTITSLAGFEAVLRGIPTVVTGMPFYAGWGFTDDRSACVRRTRQLTAEQVFAAAYLLYTKYFDPTTGKALTAEDVAERLAEAQRLLPPAPAITESLILAPPESHSATVKAEGFEAFESGSADWADQAAAKSIVFWGFAATKRPAMEAYFPGRRLLFVPENLPFPEVAQDLTRLLESHIPEHFVFWGQCTPREALAFAEAHSVPILRAGDGYIRSAEPRSNDLRPLSFVFDDEGADTEGRFYSRLERILQQTDFAGNPSLLRMANALIGMFRSFGISGYNPAALGEAHRWLGARMSRRVLVLGQMEDDTSVPDGLDNTWSNLRALELARAENPDAELIYRPHPLMAARMRDDLALTTAVSTIGRLAPPDLALSSLLHEVDQVYTISSLGGLEALIHGLPVTVLGTPFYAGWGLTDDRASLVHRGRSLTLEELFAGIYLLGPRYLADLDDPVTGCLATIMTVVAERERNAMRMASKMLGRGKPGHVLAGPHWPAALRPVEFASLNKVFGKKFSNLLDIPATFRVCAELDYQIALGLLLAGRFAGTPAGDRVARQVLMSAGPEAANAMLTLFWAMRPSPSIAQIWAIHRERTGQLDAAREVFSLLSDQPSALAIKPQIEPISAKRYAATLALAQFELRQRRLGKARELFHTLLLSGHATGEVMEGLAEIAGLSFQFRAAAEILAIFNRLEPDWRDGRGWWLETRARLLADQPFEAMRALSLAVTASDTYIEAVGSSEDGLQGAFGPLPFAMAALAIAETRVTKGDALARARAMIAREQPERAELLLRDFQPKPHEVVRHVILLSQSMSYQGRLQDAKRLLVGMLRTHSTLLIYREGVRVAILANDYAWAKELLDAAKALDFDLGDMYSRKVLLGLGEIKESYLSFRRMKASVIISKYLGARYKQSAISVREKTVSKICILACFGPGDEIRFASFYRQMADLFSSKEVAFTCDPRLEGLLNRSFSGLKFIPSRRLRYLRWADDISRYSDLPTSECFSFFDNEGWKAANASDAVMFATDLLGDVVQGKASFTGSAYFKPLMERVAYWKRRLQNYSHSPIVGINWRSTVSTHTRNEHYLSIEDMDAIFSMGNVNFINLQYDECAEELAAIEKRYPGKIINFTELDQFNDLDGVAALMECLDLVVAPATTVVELAGALGRPTLLLSNSSELHWRKREDGTDSWHRSIKHVEGEILGDKHSLAAAAAKAIEAAIASRVDSKLSKSA